MGGWIGGTKVFKIVTKLVEVTKECTSVTAFDRHQLTAHLLVAVNKMLVNIFPKQRADYRLDSCDFAVLTYIFVPIK